MGTENKVLTLIRNYKPSMGGNRSIKRTDNAIPFRSANVCAQQTRRRPYVSQLSPISFRWNPISD